MNINRFAHDYLDELKNTLLGFDYATYGQIVEKLLAAYKKQKQIFVMGNGGSGATASHFACDINKGCCFELGKKFKMICLNDNISTMLAIANDIAYESIFVEQLKNFFNPGDLVMVFSGSGNSTNVLNAIRYANENGGQTIGLSGFSGGKLAQIVDLGFVVPVHDMQKVEDVHTIVTHMIMQTLYAVLNSNQ